MASRYTARTVRQALVWLWVGMPGRVPYVAARIVSELPCGLSHVR